MRIKRIGLNSWLKLDCIDPFCMGMKRKLICVNGKFIWKNFVDIRDYGSDFFRSRLLNCFEVNCDNFCAKKFFKINSQIRCFCFHHTSCILNSLSYCRFDFTSQFKHKFTNSISILLQFQHGVKIYFMQNI